ncbi:hypothetical protein GOODEAATRI_003153, partial [Goodea atripinnis]
GGTRSLHSQQQSTIHGIIKVGGRTNAPEPSFHLFFPIKQVYFMRSLCHMMYFKSSLPALVFCAIIFHFNAAGKRSPSYLPQYPCPSLYFPCLFLLSHFFLVFCSPRLECGCVGQCQLRSIRHRSRRLKALESTGPGCSRLPLR